MEEHKKFVKVLTRTDIQQRLAVPIEFVSCNGLVDGQELEVIDFNSGNTYQFILSIRHGDYMKPVFRERGWGQFARQYYDLIPGDIIHFWKDDDQRFRICLTRDFLHRIS